MSVSALLAHDLVRTFGSRRVLDGVSLVASPGHRIGLIGENGTGKSTLLRLLAGADEPDSGSVVRPPDLPGRAALEALLSDGDGPDEAWGTDEAWGPGAGGSARGDGLGPPCGPDGHPG